MDRSRVNDRKNLITPQRNSGLVQCDTFSNSVSVDVYWFRMNGDGEITFCFVRLVAGIQRVRNAEVAHWLVLAKAKLDGTNNFRFFMFQIGYVNPYKIFVIAGVICC